MLAALLLVGLLASSFLSAPPPPRRDVEAVRPSQTRRARRAAEAPKPTQADEGEAEDAVAAVREPPPYRLVVEASELRVRGRGYFDPRGFMRPSTFWPDPDEAPLPDTEWSPGEDEFTACVDSATADAPAQPEGRAVHLSVYRQKLAETSMH